MSLFKELKEIGNIITTELLKRLEDVEPVELKEASEHLIRSGGKRLRPFIVIEIGRILGGEIEALLPAALSVEFLHNFSLIHDDIMDKDEFRRGVKTVHVVWGIPMALLAGDLLFSKAFDVLDELRIKRISYHRIERIYKLLSETAYKLAVGQGLDMKFPKIDHISLKEYIKMISFKTGALFSCSAGAGALISGAPLKIFRSMLKFGLYLGIGFQIIDDILGIVGDEKITGKPVGSDLREGKKTLPIIYGLSKGGDMKKVLKSVLGKKNLSTDEIRKAIDFLKEEGAISYSKKMAKRYLLRAQNYLNILPKNIHVNHLKELIEFIYEREY